MDEVLVNGMIALGRQLIDGKVKLGRANGFTSMIIVFATLTQPLDVTTFNFTV